MSTAKKSTPDLIPGEPPDLNRVPVNLAGIPRWLLWRLEPATRVGAPPIKVPYSPLGFRCDATNPVNWSTFDHARRVYESGAAPKYSGLGIALGELSPTVHLIGFDIDTCLDELRRPHPWAVPILTWTNYTYAEISPSLTGVKAFCIVSNPDEARRIFGIAAGEWTRKFYADVSHAGAHPPCVDVYLAKRFFTVTGLRWGGING